MCIRDRYHPDLEGKYALEITVPELAKIRALFEAFADAPVACTLVLSDGYVRKIPFDDLASATDNSAERPIACIKLEAEIDDDHPSASLEFFASRAENVEVTLHGTHVGVEALRRALEARFQAMTPSYAWLAKRSTTGMALLMAYVGVMAAAAEEYSLAALATLVGFVLVPKVWRRCFPRTSFRIGEGEKRHAEAGFWRGTVLVGIVVGIASTVVMELAKTR